VKEAIDDTATSLKHAVTAIRRDDVTIKSKVDASNKATLAQPLELLKKK